MMPRSGTWISGTTRRCFKLDCPYELISDFYYLGGYRHISTDALGQIRSISSPSRPSALRATEMTYYAHGLGADVGFALKLNDRANVAAVFGYRWNHVSGDGDVSDVWRRFAPFTAWRGF